jgi:Tol biopolymer transport system component
VACGTTALVGAGSAHAAFPGHNGRIAYSQYTETSKSQGACCGFTRYRVQTIRPDAAGRRTITQWGDEARFSPGGGSIFFSKPGELGGVFRYDLATRRQRTVYGFNDGAAGFSPAPSPWREVAFTVSGNSLWFANGDGSERRQFRIAGFDGSVGRSVWSPTGRWIAFNSYEAGKWRVYVVRLDGTGLTRRIAGEVLDWSPDGSRLLVSTRRGVVSINAWRGRATRISARARGGAYSPDGRRVVLVIKRDLYVAGVRGRGLRRLTHHGRKTTYARPDWQSRRTPLPKR